MKTLNTLLVAIALAATSLAASAHEYTLGTLHIVHPWARATAPGQPSGGVYLKVENKGGADRLVSASVDVAKLAQLHSMRMDGDVMKMEELPRGVELPAGQTVELKPGALHVMLLDLKGPLKAGDKFPMTLKFEKAGTIKVEVLVQAMGATSAVEGDMSHMEHMH